LKWLRWVVPLAALALLGCAVAWHERIWWWIEIHTGTVNESGPYYGMFSGFFGDLTIFTSAAIGLAVIYRHLNCHSQGCWRWGHYRTPDGQYKVCRHCHPVLQGRRPTRDLIHLHHRQHAARLPGESGERLHDPERDPS